MKKLIKLIILILLSLSVYFIYQKTNNKNNYIVVLGDSLSLGIDSYGIDNYSYIDYYKELSNKKVTTKKYIEKELSIKEIINTIKKEPSIKRDLREADTVIINLGYNDLIYKLALQEKINTNSLSTIISEIKDNYTTLLQEINKYYKKKIIIVGYPRTNKEDFYINEGILQLNNLLKEYKKEKDIYIDTYNLLKNRTQFFSNPNSNYPNSNAYRRLAKEILSKTLEI